MSVVAVDMEEAIRSYLRILQGGRTQDVLAKAIGFKRPNAVSQILSGERGATVEHLQALAESWGMKSSDVFADLARIAQNMELGRPASAGIGEHLPARVNAGDGERVAAAKP